MYFLNGPYPLTCYFNGAVFYKTLQRKKRRQYNIYLQALACSVYILTFSHKEV